jgi:DNA-binding LytR/AlgR family response regulator
MDNIRILIVEDQLLVAESIAAILSERHLEIAGIVSTGEEAIKAVAESPPDLILMDIKLGGKKDGIATAEHILRKENIPIIYLSDYSDESTFLRAKPTLPANYLTKPFRAADLIRAIDIAFTNAQAIKQQTASGMPQHVFVRTDTQRFSKLYPESILYLEADRAYCKVVTEDRVYTLSTSMNHVHTQLASPEFIKASRSFVVNISQVTAVEGNLLIVGKYRVQLSREFRSQVLNKLKFVR